MECAVCMDLLSSPAENLPGAINTTLAGLTTARIKGPFITSTNRRDLSVLPCGHIFHTRCVQNWIVSEIGNTTCPNCRKKISLPKIVQLASEEANATEENDGIEVIEVIDLELPDDSFDSGAGLADNLPELRMQHETLVVDYNVLKSSYLTDMEMLDEKCKSVEKYEEKLNALKGEIEKLKQRTTTLAKNIAVPKVTESRTRGLKRRCAERT